MMQVRGRTPVAAFAVPKPPLLGTALEWPVTTLGAPAATCPFSERLATWPV